MKAKYTSFSLCILSTIAFLLFGCESSASNSKVAEEKKEQPPKAENNKETQQGDSKPTEKNTEVALNTNNNVPQANNNKPLNDDEKRLQEYAQTVADKDVLKHQYINHLVTVARKKVAQDEHNGAKTLLKEAIDLDPSHVEANLLYNKVSALLGDASAKSRDLMTQYQQEELVKREQARVDAQNDYKRGMDYLQNEEYDAAIASFNLVLENIKYNSFDLNLPELERLAALKVKESQEKKETKLAELKRKRMDEARKDALRIEEEEQNRRATQIQILLTRASEYYINKKYDKAEELVSQVKEIDPSNKVAKRLRLDIFESRHDYISETTLAKRIDEWKKLSASFQEARIPYGDTVIYPDKDWWHNVVDKRGGSTSLTRDDAFKKELSETERDIMSKLNSVQITLAFTEVAFPDVIRYIQTTANINIVVDQKVLQNFETEGTKVTLSVDSVKLKVALDLLMQFYSLVYIFRDDVLFITSKDSELAKGKSIPVLHPIQDLTAQISDFPGPTVRLLETNGDDTGGGALFTETEEGPGSVITDERLLELITASIAPQSWDQDENSIAVTNGQLLIVNTEEVQEEIRKFLSDMRRFSGMMVAIETRFLDVTDDFLEHLGVDWRGIGDTQLQGLNDPNIPDDDNVVPLTGVTRADEDLAGNPDLLAGNDNLFTQALNQTVNTAAGAFFQENAGSNLDLRARTENVDEQNLGNRLFDNGGLALAFSFLDDLELNAVLRAVKKTSRQEVLFAPRITTFNTQRAHISIVQQLSYVKDFDVEVAQSAYIADPVIGTIQSGLVLDVRPTISNDKKYITLELRPTFADLVGGVFQDLVTSLGGAGTVTIQVPELQLQSVETTVRIPDQGSIMLGGFKSINQADHKQDIPILGNIPVVSFFFSQQRKVDEKRQVIILVKGKIIDLEEQEELSVGKAK